MPNVTKQRPYYTVVRRQMSSSPPPRTDAITQKEKFHPSSKRSGGSGGGNGGLERLPHVIRLARHLRERSRELRQTQLRARRLRCPRCLQGRAYHTRALGRPRARRCRAGNLGRPRAGEHPAHVCALGRLRRRERPWSRRASRRRGFREGDITPVRVLERRGRAGHSCLRPARASAGGARCLWFRGVERSGARRLGAGDGQCAKGRSEREPFVRCLARDEIGWRAWVGRQPPRSTRSQGPGEDACLVDRGLRPTGGHDAWYARLAAATRSIWSRLRSAGGARRAIRPTTNDTTVVVRGSARS